MSEGVMNKVRLGRTDLMVTSIGFGTSGLGDMPDTYGYGVDEDRAKATVLAIFGGPANLIDTSRLYGMGRSEERIGAVIRERGGVPPGFVLSTKLDRDLEGNRFDAARARRSLEESLKALGLERVDLLHLHDPEHARSFKEATARDGALGEALPDQRGGAGEGGGPRSRPGDDDDAALERLGFRRAYHPQSLHPRQPQRRRDAQSRAGRGRSRSSTPRPTRAASSPRDRAPTRVMSIRKRPTPCSIRSAGSRRSAPAFVFRRGPRRCSSRYATPRVTSTICGVTRPERVQETLDWANFPNPRGRLGRAHGLALRKRRSRSDARL